jgi:hypothetical protein
VVNVTEWGNHVKSRSLSFRAYHHTFSLKWRSNFASESSFLRPTSSPSPTSFESPPPTPGPIRRSIRRRCLGEGNGKVPAIVV